MPKVDELLKREPELPRLQQVVYEYLQKHPDEVFSANDDDLDELKSKLKTGTLASLAFSFWALHKERKLIGRERVKGRYYYGSETALKKLRNGTNQDKRK
jgi:hypothetical protein